MTERFDAVVIGGGPAGEVVVGRLHDLAREDDRVSELLADYLVKDGIDVQLGTGAAE
jgi:pyruvate/2-oxoglutarate dehydrogenase complex dihydrolipoamide dehydrogenase (E3) component